MVGKVVFLAIVLLSISPNQVLLQTPRFFPGFQTLTNGFQSMGSILSGGVQSVSDQMNQLATDIKLQTNNIIDRGAQMTATAVEQISFPGISMGTSLLIGKFNMVSRTTGHDVVTLPGVNANVMSFGTLRTSNGTLRRLSTMVQDGPLNVTAGRMTIRISIPVKFTELGVSYNQYSFSTWGINISGNMSATIGNNSFTAHVLLQPGITCQVTVERVEVTRLEGVDVQMTGLCAWCSSIVSAMANYFQGMMRVEVQKAVDTQLRAMTNDIRVFLCPTSQVGR